MPNAQFSLCPLGMTSVMEPGISSKAVMSISVLFWSLFPLVLLAKSQLETETEWERVVAGDPAEPSLSLGAAMWGMSMPDWPDRPGCRRQHM